MIAQRTGRNFTPAQREIYKTVGGTPSLDGNYTVYGIVLEGMDVVDKIVNMPRNQMDRPNTDIAMKHVYMMDRKMEKKWHKKHKKD